MTQKQVELVYVGDPMCSWCWGFAPTLDALLDRYEKQLPLRAIMGGLRPDADARPLDHSMRRFLRDTWQEVQRRSGQPFDYNFLEREGFLYDTGPACRAVVAMRGAFPAETYRFFRWLQEQFYRRGVDIISSPVIESYLALRGLDRRLEQSALGAREVVAETLADYRLARSLGVTGFPTLLLSNATGTVVVSRGAEPLETVAVRVERALR